MKGEPYSPKKEPGFFRRLWARWRDRGNWFVCEYEVNQGEETGSFPVLATSVSEAMAKAEVELKEGTMIKGVITYQVRPPRILSEILCYD